MKKHALLLWFMLGLISIITACREDLRDIKLEVDESSGLDLHFTFVDKPDPGMELIANLYYTEEENEPFYDRNPDKILKHTLNARDIEHGLTLTFDDPIPLDFAYVIAYVDVDANGVLSDGDIAICYLAQSVREVIKGIAAAENVSFRKFLTLTMDQVYSSIRPPLEVDFTFPSPPLPGSRLTFGLYYAESQEEALLDRDPDIFWEHILSEDDIINGLTSTFENVQDFPFLYALAYVDINDDGNLSYGDIAMFYGGISVNDVEKGRDLPENISVRGNITMKMSEWYANENGPLTDIDGNVYKTVVIGDLEWMAENLKVTRYRNGAPIPTDLSNTEWITTTTGAYAVYPYTSTNGEISSAEEMVNKHGLLYNGYAVMSSEGLAPIGWRVATDEDYKNLEYFAGLPESELDKTGNDRGMDASIAYKLRSTEWIIGDPAGKDEFGFNGLSSGYRQGAGDGEFIRFNHWEGNNLWTSTSGGSSNFIYRRSIRVHPILRQLVTTRVGASVRCVRDKQPQ